MRKHVPTRRKKLRSNERRTWRRRFRKLSEIAKRSRQKSVRTEIDAETTMPVILVREIVEGMVLAEAMRGATADRMILPEWLNLEITMDEIEEEMIVTATVIAD